MEQLWYISIVDTMPRWPFLSVCVCVGPLCVWLSLCPGGGKKKKRREGDCALDRIMMATLPPLCAEQVGTKNEARAQLYNGRMKKEEERGRR